MDKKLIMKRYKDLWQKFCNKETAIQAIIEGSRNKRKNHSIVRRLGNGKGGLDPQKVGHMAETLVQALENGWKPSPCRHMRKTCKSSGKVREIDCPPLADHFVHWMLILAIKDPLMRGMYLYSCGSIPGRGIEYARKNIEKWARDRESKWFVKLDVTKFYQSIDHGVLKSKLRKLIKDEKTLDVIDKIIDVIDKGLAIGSYTSQWFANLYLQDADHFIKEQLFKMRRGKRVNAVSHYLRYMDDILLIGTSKRDLDKAVRSIIKKFREDYKLTIKPEWEIKALDTYPIDMVGYRFYRDHTEMRGRIFLHAKRLAKKIYKAKAKTHRINAKAAQGLVSLLGWAEHCDSKSFQARYINPYVNVSELKGVISRESKKHGTTGGARRY